MNWMILFLGAEAVVGALAVFFLIRNQFVYFARVAAIDCRDWPVTYKRLPSYDEMLLRPKYWLLWTPSHWMAWVARQPEAAAVPQHN